MRAPGFVLHSALAALVGLGAAPARAAVTVLERGGSVTLENELVRVEYDLAVGTYRIFDERDGACCLAGACFGANGLTSKDAGVRQAWKSAPIRDELGAGKELIITVSGARRPDLILGLSLRERRGAVVLRVGVGAAGEGPLRVKKLVPIAGAGAFGGFDLARGFAMLDGNGGGEATRIRRGGSLRCRNNLLVTFGAAGARRSLVFGGLTYHDFEKFAAAGEALRRRDEIARRGGLRCYIDLPAPAPAPEAAGPRLTLVQGKPFRWSGAGSVAAPELGSIAFHEKAIVIEAAGLDPRKHYSLGLSWWDFDNNGRTASVWIDGGEGAPRLPLLEKHRLPAWRSKHRRSEECLLSLPAGAYRDGRARISITNEASTPNIVASEVWLREDDGPHAVSIAPVAGERGAPPRSLAVRLHAEDPVGKLVEGGGVYQPDDRFYVDVSTDNPIAALEAYAQSVRAAQRIDLDVYDFPTVCLWYAEVYGKGQASNDTPGAAAEMDAIARSGFLEYSRAAVRLVPDLYTADNQQGWWDDAHWHRGRSTPERGNGQYAAPYLTSRAWGRAVTERGGIPLTYFQTGFRSEDYARAFPEHMLFDEAQAPRHDAAGRPRPFSPKQNAWQRNGALHGYDYTDPGFLRHMREVYAGLRAGGIKGLMFDYPSSGWAAEGGMEDRHSTTAAAYRRIFALAREGLGPECWIHERALQRGSDIALGLITSQRVWGDTDRLAPAMVTRCALRWYKNRVVVHYDMDAKSLLKADPPTRDGLRQLLTMCSVVSGRLLLGNSFRTLSEQQIHDLTRIFPYPRLARSARPADAFTSETFPRVYDLEVDPAWHQVTLYNPEKKRRTIAVDLSGETGFGGLGLDPGASYHVYDFWNDAYAGRRPGSARLEQELRPGEARMLSVRRALDRPQIISTNRHVLQGVVDLAGVGWDGSRRELRGRASVAGGEPWTAVIALNGHEPAEATAGESLDGSHRRKAAMVMTHRERVLTALAREVPDRCPCQVSFTPEFAARLRGDLGLRDGAAHNPHGGGNTYELERRLGEDLLLTSVGWANSYYQDRRPYTDEWGVGWVPSPYTTRFGAGVYTEIAEHPLARDDAISRYRPPDPTRPELYAEARRVVETFRDEYWITGVVVTTIFETAWALRGLEALLVDLETDPDRADAVLEIPYRYHREAAERLARIGVDMIWLGDDVGMQTGMLISPATWRRALKPRMAELIAALKGIHPGVRIAYHSDGDIRAIIPELIEIGVEVLNPVQPACMDPAALKREYGDRLCFWGTVDEQHTLPFGSPADVRREVADRLETIGRGGGLIIGPTHHVQLDTPPENFRAMMRAIAETPCRPLRS